MKVNQNDQKKKKGISTKFAMNLIMMLLGVFTVGYLVALGFLVKKTGDRGKTETIQEQICFEEVCFDIEIASSPEERQQGLMFREQMDENKGMLFLFDEAGRYSFWMKNTLIPLDMIWLDENLKVIFVENNVPPCPEKFSQFDACNSYGPDFDSNFVLEINAGLAEQYGIQIGSQARTVGTGSIYTEPL